MQKVRTASEPRLNVVSLFRLSDYQGARTARAIVDFATGLLSNHVVNVKSAGTASKRVMLASEFLTDKVWSLSCSIASLSTFHGCLSNPCHPIFLSINLFFVEK
jgi:hypothetical protein